MSSSEIGSVALTLSVILAVVHLFGYLFERLKQPRLIGEILGGTLLGPFVLGKYFPGLASRLFGTGSLAGDIHIVLGFIYWIGLFLLMFLSGSETRRLLAKENRKETAWLFSIGTTLPFCLVLVVGSLLPLHHLTGSAGQRISTLLVLAIAVAVTSIPVISRIFFDLRIIHTRFASLVLSFAVLEDIVLWAILAVATGLAGNFLLQNISIHLGLTFAYMGIGLFLAPRLLKRLHQAKWNVLVRASSVGYLFVLLFIYAAVAAMMDVNLVFAAFLAGFGLVGGLSGSQRARFSEQLESISKVSAGVFIPIYFAMVGYKLTLGRDFSLSMFLVFLFASSAVALLSFSLASFLAGFRGLDIVNLAITKNARGGPGIVLASVALDAGIINPAFYTTLVLTAVLTSQAAGVWLRFVLQRGWPLLSASSSDTADWRSEEKLRVSENHNWSSSVHDVKPDRVH
jgi:Kef-type K+ transport system membrane component KefB